MGRRIDLFLAALLAAGGCGGPAAAPRRDSVELLVFAPHPDDEALGCAGILRQALAQGRRVKIVIFTNGDGFPGLASLITRKPIAELAERDFRELARFRQAQSQEALRALGGQPQDLIFLGYPDSALDAVYQNRGAIPARQKFTGLSRTYGVAQPDFHTAVHGGPAPYTHDAVLADLRELFERLRPARVCVTHEDDRHPDHQATFRFVRDAAEQAGYSGPIDRYLIHGGPEWPWPAGSTPALAFEAHEVKGERSPRGVPWPPPLRVPLSPEDARSKEAAVRAHASHLAGEKEGSLKEERIYLESFVKSEELFWPLEARR